MFIVIAGNPVDGFRCWGPFDNSDEAIHWTENQRWDDGIFDWVVMPIESKES